MAATTRNSGGRAAGRARKLTAELAAVVGAVPMPPAGQPRVQEALMSPSQKLQVTVLWDKWDRVAGFDRFLITRAACALVWDAAKAE